MDEKVKLLVKGWFAVLKHYFSCWTSRDFPSFVLPRFRKKFFVRSFILGCEWHDYAVVDKDCQEASQVSKSMWFFVVHDGYDAF
jgi:hypothetical protein